MHILWTYWNNFPTSWKELLFKEWLYFIRKKESLDIFLGDDSYGLDYLLCESLGFVSDDTDTELAKLDKYIKYSINKINTEILTEIFDMEFIALDCTITYISPLRYFRNLKIVDFHCSNESKITDFLALERETKIYIFDYADYQIVDFDNTSNIRQFSNIIYIKGHEIIEKIDKILINLSNYNIK